MLLRVTANLREKNAAKHHQHERCCKCNYLALLVCPPWIEQLDAACRTSLELDYLDVRLDKTVRHLGINAHSARLVFDAARILVLRLSSKARRRVLSNRLQSIFFETWPVNDHPLCLQPTVVLVACFAWLCMVTWSVVTPAFCALDSSPHSLLYACLACL